MELLVSGLSFSNTTSGLKDQNFYVIKRYLNQNAIDIYTNVSYSVNKTLNR